MQLTLEQVMELAPDASSASAGRKLGTASVWRNPGQSPEALWGECQGSTLYQVRVDLSDLTIKCSCPSRKFPCKHGLGLLVLAADQPAALPIAEPPEWVAEWLGRRSADATKRETTRAEKTARPVATRSRSADKRLARVTEGLDGLDLWMNDLIRNGLAAVETQPVTFWERQAARMVDAQAPGMAARLRRMSLIPYSSPDWPEKLLAQLGKLALLTEAFRRLQDLDPALQEDIRQAIGWTLIQEEVAERGDAVEDDWYVLGQRVTGDDEKLRTQWTWLLGSRTGRYGLVLQFSAAGRPFGESFLPGTCQHATLAYWPSSFPQRALVLSRSGGPTPIRGEMPGFDSLRGFLVSVAEATGRQPWLDRFPCVLKQVVPVRDSAGRWWVRDREGCALPLSNRDHWKLLALSGGLPVWLSAEWDRYSLLPLGALAAGKYFLLQVAA